MPAFRYIIAGSAAVLIVAAGVVFCVLTQRTVLEATRQNLREAKAAGELPDELQDVDIEQLEPGAISTEVSSSLLFRLSVADFLSKFWFVFAPLVFLVCFGVAALFRRGSQ